MKSKRCSTCGRIVPLGEFLRYPASKDGYGYKCAACRSSWKKKRYIKDRKRILVQKKEYAKTEHGRKTTRKARLKKKYGITLEQHEVMYVSQDGRCLVCLYAVPYSEIYTDHCHKTGKVRGLLCRKCNFMLGNAMDDPTVLKRAAKYLRGWAKDCEEAEDIKEANKALKRGKFGIFDEIKGEPGPELDPGININ